MTVDEVEVWTTTAEGDRRVGTLRPSFMGGRTLASSSFEYDASFIRDGWQVSPDLPLRAGRIYTRESATLPGSFSDAAPDDWGQKIIRADNARRRAADPSLPARLGEFDYLLGVSDHTRAGSLRFRRRGHWLSSEKGVANVHALPRLLEAARRYEDDEASADDIAYLNDVATSPGGARPKANVETPSGRLAIAKLPHSKDGTFDVERWEAVALTIARNAEIKTPRWTLAASGSGRAVLISERFDRGPGDERWGYMSARTALELGAHDDGSRLTYEDFTDAIAEWSNSARADLREMFARVALSVLINNVDDHWRNHAFVRDTDGWRLSPVFDVNPSRQRGVIDSRPIDSNDDPGDRQLHRLLATASAYRLTDEAARGVLRRVAAAVAGWDDVASELGIAADERARLSVAFDAHQRDWALAL